MDRQPIYHLAELLKVLRLAEVVILVFNPPWESSNSILQRFCEILWSAPMLSDPILKDDEDFPETICSRNQKALKGCSNTICSILISD